MKNHPHLDEAIRAYQGAVRRLAIESASGEFTPYFQLDFGYDWTPVPVVDAEDGGGLWARSLILPEDHDGLTITFFDWRSGRETYHKHAEQEVVFVVKGVYVLTVEGEDQTLVQGSSFMVPAYTRHSLRCVEPGLTLSVFEPPLPLVVPSF